MTRAEAAQDIAADQAALFDEFAPRRGEIDASLDDQIAEVEREIRMRRRLYPAWVANGKLSDATASRQMNAMLTVRRTLLTLRARQGGAP